MLSSSERAANPKWKKMSENPLLAEFMTASDPPVTSLSLFMA